MSAIITLRRRQLALLLAAGGLLGTRAGHAAEIEPWDVLREELFGDRPIADGDGVVALEAPVRAYDAAVVPVSITALIPQTAERHIRTVHLIIDRNPAPLAAVFRLQPEGGSASLATRVRVNEYTTVRAIAETSDGALWMAQRFVKAAGGCSAPATKDMLAAEARLGKMKLKQLTPFAVGEPMQLELLVSHPQYTGMQIDQLSRNWIPPDHLRTIAVRWQGRPLLEVEADISLSEDPAIAFALVPDGPGELAVAVDDIKGRHFEQSWSLGAGS